MLKKLLAHPLTRGLDLDDPRTTELRRRIIRSKPLLRQIYQEWYGWIAANLPPGEGRVVELGSGPGFLAEHIPGLVTSELFLCQGIKLAADGQSLPFADGSLRAIVFTDVLHHLPRARQFFRDAVRCVRPGGRILMVEPWVTSWSSWIYPRFHHERYDPRAPEWEFPASGPLSGSNQALPWIIFARDRAVFEREFPEWKIGEIVPVLPLRYLVSGGLATRNLAPAWSLDFWRGAEQVFLRCFPSAALFARVILNRQTN